MPRELAHELKLWNLWNLKCLQSEHDLLFPNLTGGFIHERLP
jgi:hypothetical protein